MKSNLHEFKKNNVKKVRKTWFVTSIALSLLLQSCFSYSKIDANQDLTAGKKYKIKQANGYQKIIVISSTDSTIIATNSKKNKIEIARKRIKAIKKRHFSISKTVLLPVGIVVVGTATIIAAGDLKLNLFSK